MKSHGVKKNLVFQFTYQFIILVIPLVISPYLTRTLGETAIGEYAYANSIAYYFVLICMLGIVKHGQRVIASKRNDDIELRKTFWSLFSVHVFFSIIGMIGYIIFCCFIVDNNPIIYYTQGLYVFSAFFDITWLFYGIECFKSVIIRNILVKITELFLIFTTVKSNNDIVLYSLIMSTSTLVSYISLFPTAMRLVKPIKFGIKDIKEHIKPLFMLSLSVVAISLYTVFDKTLLGLLSTKESVAYYEYSNKIINIPKVFVTVIGTVLFPRSCNCIANNDFDGSKRYYKYSLAAVYFIGCASVFGLLGVSDLFAVVYYGKDFAICGSIIKSLTPIILIIGIGDIFRMQFLIPMRKDIEYIICILINAVINIVLSTWLIPIIGIYGAVIGTTCAEIFGMIYQLLLIKKYISIRSTIGQFVPFAVSGLIMWGSIELIKAYANINILHLSIQMIVGVFNYITVLLIWFIGISKHKSTNRKMLKRLLRISNC